MTDYDLGGGGYIPLSPSPCQLTPPPISNFTSIKVPVCAAFSFWDQGESNPDLQTSNRILSTRNQALGNFNPKP